MGKVTARFALQGQPCAKPYRVRALPALGYRAFQVLDYVRSYFAEHGKTPRYEEICEGVGVGTHGEVSRIISSLERRDLLGRTGKGSARRITMNTANKCPPDRMVG